MRRLLWIAALCLAVPALPALAGGPVTIEDVRTMAFDKGVDLIDEIELDDGIWKVRGHDKSGHKIKIEVDAASGQMVKIKRR